MCNRYFITIDFEADGESDRYTTTVEAVCESTAYEVAFDRLTEQYGAPDDVTNCDIKVLA